MTLGLMMIKSDPKSIPKTDPVEGRTEIFFEKSSLGPDVGIPKYFFDPGLVFTQIHTSVTGYLNKLKAYWEM